MNENRVCRQEGIATVDKMNIWYETFGERSSPAFLLIMGSREEIEFIYFLRNGFINILC